MIATYQVMFGENPETNDLVEQNSFKFAAIFYFIHSNMINVISLNILISIVTDNYDNVQSRMNAIDLKAKAAILLQHESVMIWNRKITDMQYLFLMRYKKDGIEGFSGDEEWQGKMRVLKNSVNMVQEMVGKKITKLNEKVERVDQSVADVATMIKDDFGRVKTKMDAVETDLENMIKELGDDEDNQTDNELN